MSGSAVQFGAGNIGRGFLAQIFTESGLDVVFVDVFPTVVNALNQRGSYPIHVVDEGAAIVTIRNVRALHGSDIEHVAEELAIARIASTAVGAHALPQIAPSLAAGLIARFRLGAGPINIIVCENLHDAAERLRSLVSERLPDDDRVKILALTGFVQAVVSRMVPARTEEERDGDPLPIRVEAYNRLPIDGNAIVGSIPPLVGVEQTSSFAACVERKLYTHNCAHAVLGFLGHIAGHRYGYEALEDARISALLRAVLVETSEALIRKHGFIRQEQEDHVADLLARFRNRALGDTCRRLARDPLRKLAPDDRLVGAARLCESQRVEPCALAWAIVAALRYDDPEDPSASEMRRMIREMGRDSAISSICGIDPGEPLAALIREAFDTTDTLSMWTS